MYGAAARADGAIEIEDRIRSHTERINQEIGQLLPLIAEFDRREAWRADGAHSMTHWLRFAHSVSDRTAREWTEAAQSLDSLPKISAALAHGSLTWDQVRPLASFATGELDEQLAEEARGWTPADLEEQARSRRRIDREQAEKTMNERYVKRCWDRDTGTLRVWGRLPYEQGALVEKTLDTIAEQARANGADGFLRELRADALAELCSNWSTARTHRNRATIVVHVKEKDLGAVRGTGELENGVLLASETIRRLGCDSRVQMIVESEDGGPIGVGRTTRSVPQWLMRLLRYRDGHCRFPDCERETWLAAHHKQHWSRGGRTDLGNLFLLCGYHHWLLHECGFRADGDPDRELTFCRRDGLRVGQSSARAP